MIPTAHESAMPVTTDIDDMIASIHEGVFERPYWTGFLAKARAMAQADYASLVFRRSDADHADITIISSGGQVGSPSEKGGVKMARRLNLVYQSLQLNRPYTLREIFDHDDDRVLEYMDYLQDRHIHDAIVIRVGGCDHGIGWLTLGRLRPGLEASVAALLTRIAPHLNIAVRTLAELEFARIRADVAQDAVQRLNFGWLTFDARGSILEIDPVAKRLFMDTPGLSGCTRGSIFPVGLSGTHHDLRDILNQFSDDRNARSRAMHLADDPSLDMLVVPIAYRSVSGGHTPIAAGYVHGVSPASEDRCEQLKQLFGLTSSEAKLALAMSRGKTITEAAADLGLTVETARNYSKHVYAKTDTRGHADLVRIILASVIALT